MAGARRWTHERGVLWVIELHAAPPRVQPRIRAQFGTAGLEAAAELARVMEMDVPSVRARLESGRRCFVARVEGAIAAYGWVSRRNEYIGEQERDIQLQAVEAYIWDCVTLARYRNQRLYSALLGEMLVALREEGVRRVWIGTGLANQASLRAFANAGFQPVLTLSYARGFRLRFLWMSGRTGAPRELVAAARRALLTGRERMWGSFGLGWSAPIA